MENDTHKSLIPLCRIWPRDESNGKIFWGNYIYLLEFSYDIRWCKVKLLHFFDTFGIISLRWRVTRTSVLYPRVGHGPGINRKEKVHEVTTCISSIFRMIFGDVRSNCYTFLTHLEFFPLRWRVTRTSVLYPRVGHRPGMNRTEKVYEVTTFISSIFRMIFGDVRSNCYTFLTHLDFFSAVEDDTHKSFIPPCRTWPRDESNGKSSWGNYIYLLDFSYDIRWCKVKLLHFFDTFGIISLRWRVKRTTLLYPRVGHGPGLNRTEKVHEVTTFISSIFRMIFGDVRSNCYTFLTHLE